MLTVSPESLSKPTLASVGADLTHSRPSEGPLCGNARSVTLNANT
jgi:hypothetical protein